MHFALVAVATAALSAATCTYSRTASFTVSAVIPNGERRVLSTYKDTNNSTSITYQPNALTTAQLYGSESDFAGSGAYLTFFDIDNKYGNNPKLPGDVGRTDKPKPVKVLPGYTEGDWLLGKSPSSELFLASSPEADYSFHLCNVQFQSGKLIQTLSWGLRNSKAKDCTPLQRLEYAFVQ